MREGGCTGSGGFWRHACTAAPGYFHRHHRHSNHHSNWIKDTLKSAKDAIARVPGVKQGACAVKCAARRTSLNAQVLLLKAESAALIAAHKIAMGIGRVWAKLAELGSYALSINNITAAGELSVQNSGLTLLVDVRIFGHRRKWEMRVGSHKPVNVSSVGTAALEAAKDIVNSNATSEGVESVQLSREEDDMWLVADAIASAFSMYKHARQVLCKHRGGPMMQACLRVVADISEDSWLVTTPVSDEDQATSVQDQRAISGQNQRTTSGQDLSQILTV